MNVELCHVAAGPQTKPTNLDHELHLGWYTLHLYHYILLLLILLYINNIK